MLADARSLIDPAMRAAVATIAESVRTPAEYHFGWVDRDGSPTTARSGKAMRPALVLLGARAAGGDDERAVSGAVAIELIHNFSLIHDDVMDGDRTRHHRPTVWDVYGVSDALLVGDAMHALAIEVLLGPSGDHTVSAAAHLAALRRLAEATSAMLKGQAEDTSLSGRSTTTLTECLEMERNKTASLFGGSIAIGALLADGDAQIVAAVDHYGSELGMAFQAVDDLLGIWGDPATTGKPVGNDLREHKKSLPVVLALVSGGELGDRVRAALDRPLDDDDVAALTAAMDDAGLRTVVRQRAERHVAAGLAALDDVAIVAPVRAQLDALAEFVITRSY